MTNDLDRLVEKLRDLAGPQSNFGTFVNQRVLGEAADLIESQAAEIARLTAERDATDKDIERYLNDIISLTERAVAAERRADEMRERAALTR